MCYFYSRGCILALRSVLLVLLLNFQGGQSFHHFHFPAIRGAAVLPPTRRASGISTTTSVTWTASSRSSSMTLASSFYGKFEEDSDDNEAEDDEDEEEDEDDDDDEYLDLDDNSLADFRSKMSNLYDDDDDNSSSSSRSSSDAVSSVEQLISYARSINAAENTEPKDWARPVNDKRIQKGMVLLANPAKFCSDFDASGTSGRPNPALLAKFGLTLPPPADLGPDRRADLLPVLVIVEHDDENDDDAATSKTQPFLLPFLSRGRDQQTRGILLNRRTGYLLGDLEPPPPPPSTTSSSGGSDSSSSSSSAAAATGMLEKFCIQPLWFGGVDNLSTGLDMLHLCPNVPDAVQLTDDGLWWGGDPGTAQDCMSDPTLDRVYTGFDFKFFAQSTVWAPGDLAKQIASDTWFCAHVSKEVLFKSRDRMGTQRAKPLWTEIMELMGGEYQDVRDKLYKNP